jgi:hypothetical protein
MDSKGFRLKSEPDLVRQPSRFVLHQETMRETEATKTVPAPDNRYPAYAAPMSDGRLVTDYRDRCVTRAPPGTQFAVKGWTVHNTDEIIRISRLRQVQATGQALGVAATELPPATYQTCDTNTCTIRPSGYTGGVGIERTDKAPELFGTFTFSPDYSLRAKNKEFTNLNRVVEYGRNTPMRWANLYQ